MKYMLWMWAEGDATGGTKDDFEAWDDFEQEARDAGVYLDGGAFQSPGDGRLVRTTLSGADLGDAVKTGTFSPGPVQLAAFYLLRCEDLGEATVWANRLPTYGSVEVRELVEYEF